MLAGVITGFAEGPLFMLFELLVGIGLAGGYALLGATWLVDQDRGRPACARAALEQGRGPAGRRRGGGDQPGHARSPVPASCRSGSTWPRLLWLAPLPLLTGGRLRRHLALDRRGCSTGNPSVNGCPFVLSVWVFVFAFAGLAYSLFPYLVVDRMTIWQAAAAPESLRFVFVGACVVLPLIVGYTVFAYRVFWGKARSLTYHA